MLTRILAVLLAVGIVLALGQFPQQAIASAGGTQSEHGGAEDGAKALNPVSYERVEGFNFLLDLSVWTAVVFVIVLAVLYKYAWGPIAKGLDQREHDIASQIAEAHRHNEEAKQLLVDYEKKIAAAHDEVRQIIDEGRRNSERLGVELIDKAKQEAAAEAQRGKQQIQSATTAALHELAQLSSQLAVELAGKIVRQKLAPSDHAQLIGDAVSKFKMQAQASGGSSSTPV